MFGELLADRFDFLCGPSPMFHFAFEPVLDYEAPACFAGLPAVALKSDHQLFELVAGKYFGLGNERQGLGAPLMTSGVNALSTRHARLVREMSVSAPWVPSIYRATQHGQSGHVNEQIWAEFVEITDALRQCGTT